MRRELKAVLLASALIMTAAAAQAQDIRIRNLAGRPMEASQGVSWGVPFAKGSVAASQTFTLKDSKGNPVDVQSYPLAYWPDGSMKWVGFAAVSGSGLDNLTLSVNPLPKKGEAAPQAVLGEPLAAEKDGSVTVSTGAISVLFPSEGSSIMKDIAISGTTVASEAHLVAQAMQANGENSYVSKVEKVTVMLNTPMKATVKVEGKHAMINGRSEWLPFAVYCVFYKDMPTIGITHSFIFDKDGQSDFIEGIGLSFSVPFREEVHNRHARFAGDGADGAGFWCQPVRLAPGYRPSAGDLFKNNYQAYLEGAKLPDLSEMQERERNAVLTCPIWGDMRLTQLNSNGFSVDKRTTPKSSWVHVTEGKRSLGGALLGDTSGSIFVGIKDFWQSYPASLQVDRAGEDVGSLTAWLWTPDAPSMDLRHYDTIGHDLSINYEDWKPEWDSPYGIGHRSTIEVRLFNNIPSNEDLWQVAEAVQKPVQYTCTPEYYYSVHAFGDYWNLPDMSNPVYAAIEKELNYTFDFYRDQIEQRYWYGFWNYGDVMHNYDYTRHDWRYDIGGWAWNNTELSPNSLLWTSFLRTGREDIWTMAEALEKHSSEVDVFHIGEFAPLGSRHNVSHWGDGAKQPRIENSSMKRFMYYLMGGEELTGDLMREQLGADRAYDYVKRICTRNPAEGTYLSTGIGDWTYYASNWMVEWERTGDKYWGDRLLNSMKDAVALGRGTGSLGFDYFDPETGRMMVWLNEKAPDMSQLPVGPDGRPMRGMFRRETCYAPKSEFVPAGDLKPKKLQSIIGYRQSQMSGGDTFSLIFGAPEFLADMKATVDYPEFWSLADGSFRAVSHSAGGSMTGPRAASWVAYDLKDREMGELAWKNLLDNGFTATQSDGTVVRTHPDGEKIATRNIINPVEEPMFQGQSAGWQLHTPSTVQWMLNAIETMEWGKDYVPSSVPAAYTDSMRR